MVAVGVRGQPGPPPESGQPEQDSAPAGVVPDRQGDEWGLGPLAPKVCGAPGCVDGGSLRDVCRGCPPRESVEEQGWALGKGTWCLWDPAQQRPHPEGGRRSPPSLGTEEPRVGAGAAGFPGDHTQARWPRATGASREPARCSRRGPGGRVPPAQSCPAQDPDGWMDPSARCWMKGLRSFLW